MIHEARRERLRALLHKENLSALLVSSAAARFYLSGFELHDPQPGESAGVLVIGRKPSQDLLFTDPRYTEAAGRVWPKDNVRIYSHSAMAMVGEALREYGSSVGFEAKSLSVAQWDALRNAATGLTFTPADGLVEGLRRIKDDDEIARMRESCVLNHRLMAHVEALLPTLDGHATETSLAWEIERFFRENGASELAFSSIVAYNANAALPHSIPSSAVSLQPGGFVLVDVGCRLDDYCSDQTRTFWIGGTPSSQFQKTMDLVREAQRKGIEAIRPGVRACDVYTAARSFFAAHDVAHAFTHGLGHGIGLETHESPSLNPRNETILEPGMIVTVEPGLYYPEWGGIRWEYMALVTPDGCELL